MDADNESPLSAYLATRVVELLVHADDLATSIGIDTPSAPVALDIAIPMMCEASRLVHGDWAVLRTLTRRERAPETISVF